MVRRRVDNKKRRGTGVTKAQRRGPAPAEYRQMHLKQRTAK
jgi:hypothetical protein